ncbi:MAG: hypothetical protein CMO74_15525 [Verrucomicrobiales bacterium]|nr:hypothetical protein [Verrucomicrobiales bacterium]
MLVSFCPWNAWWELPPPAGTRAHNPSSHPPVPPARCPPRPWSHIPQPEDGCPRHRHCSVGARDVKPNSPAHSGYPLFPTPVCKVPCSFQYPATGTRESTHRCQWCNKKKSKLAPTPPHPYKSRVPASPAPFDLAQYSKRHSAEVNRALSRHLPSARTRPATIHQAMRYSLFAGGKRIRPILTLAAAEACGGTPRSAMPLACAVECIHTYSLIHDDLPAMDNDDFRRGRPTSHKVYGEGVAILAGDALLTQAFEIAAQAKPTPRYSTATIIRELTETSGSLKLIAGQVADLEGEGNDLSMAQLRYIHERKTSALLACSVRLGGMSANCTPRQLSALTDFGRHVGLAFQVIDDILDVTQTTEQLGKTAGKDEAAAKATYPAIIGLSKSKKIAAQLTDKAFAALKPFHGKATALEAIAGYLLKRDN